MQCFACPSLQYQTKPTLFPIHVYPISILYQTSILTLQLDPVSKALVDSGVPGAVRVSPRPPLHAAAEGGAASAGPVPRAEPIILSDDDEDMDIPGEAKQILKTAQAAAGKAVPVKKEKEAEKARIEEERKRRGDIVST